MLIGGESNEEALKAALSSGRSSFAAGRRSTRSGFGRFRVGVVDFHACVVDGRTRKGQTALRSCRGACNRRKSRCVQRGQRIRLGCSLRKDDEAEQRAREKGRGYRARDRGTACGLAEQCVRQHRERRLLVHQLGGETEGASCGDGGACRRGLRRRRHKPGAALSLCREMARRSRRLREPDPGQPLEDDQGPPGSPMPGCTS